MPTKGPSELTIRTYQVGFGDCFLLSFKYPTEERHVLIDFGSTRLSEGASLEHVAADIEEVVGENLVAVVATHRHKDHLSGFATDKKGNGQRASGSIIRACKPKYVLMPWTETPDLARSARAPAGSSKGFVQTLGHMHTFARAALEAARARGSLSQEDAEQIELIADDNLKNESAVRNLATMGKPLYLHHGQRPTQLERLLPGVRIDVLGPPTLEQTSAITKQRAKDRDEFWTLQGMNAGENETGNGRALFPDAPTLSSPPPDMRWFCSRVTHLANQQLLSIVRILDCAMNNTSLILLFTVGRKRLLFPGDAQIESWRYALSEAKNHEQMRKQLAAVDVYKVGHHGSLNATPLTLWNGFDKRAPRSNPRRMKSLMSTLPGVHGKEESATEVPRRRLATALSRETELHRTDKLRQRAVCDVVTLRTH